MVPVVNATGTPTNVTTDDTSWTAPNAVVQIIAATDHHRRMFRIYDGAEFIVGLWRDGHLVDLSCYMGGPDLLPILREKAKAWAEHVGGVYLEACRWCGISCPPVERRQHEWLLAASEMSWRGPR